MTARMTLTDICNSALGPLEILDISFQLHINLFSATQVSQFHLTVYDKPLGRTDIVKVTYEAKPQRRCDAGNNYWYYPLTLETTSKQCDSAVINACLLRQTELCTPGAWIGRVMISTSAFK